MYILLFFVDFRVPEMFSIAIASETTDKIALLKESKKVEDSPLALDVSRMIIVNRAAGNIDSVCEFEVQLII